MSDTRHEAAEFLATKYDLTRRDYTARVVQICVPVPCTPTTSDPSPVVAVERHNFDVYQVIELLQAERKKNERLTHKLRQLESMLVTSTAEMRRLINGEDPT